MSNNRFSLSNKIALVTGASRGLGKAIALGFAEAGADIILVSRRREVLDTISEEIEKNGNKSWIFPFDLIKTGKIQQLYNRIIDIAKHVDILVNVAGTTHRQAAIDVPLDKWHHVLELNLTATFVISQCFARSCINSKLSGKIINITSLLSEAARSSIPAYMASKGAVTQLTKALAVEWAPHHINVNAIGPGYFNTEMTKSLIENEKFNQWVLDSTPMKRWGIPEDLVGAAIFLASESSDFITGQTIYVDGGWLANL